MTKPADFFGEAEFDYDGFHYKLTLNNMALIHAEGVLGESMLDFVPRIQLAMEAGRNPLIRDIGAILFGGLRNNHGNISETVVYDMAMSRNTAMLVAFSEALSAVSMPETPAGNAASPEPNRKARRAKKGGTGSASSGSGVKRGSRQKGSG